MKLHRHQDTDNESRAAEALSRFLNGRVSRTPEGCVFDFAVRKDVSLLTAIIEYKRRNFEWATMLKEVWVSARKLLECVTFAEKEKVPFLFVVEANDGMRCAYIDRSRLRSMKLVRGGRYDRGIANDSEMMALVPSSWWTNINK